MSIVGEFFHLETSACLQAWSFYREQLPAWGFCFLVGILFVCLFFPAGLLLPLLREHPSRAVGTLRCQELSPVLAIWKANAMLSGLSLWFPPLALLGSFYDHQIREAGTVHWTGQTRTFLSTFEVHRPAWFRSLRKSSLGLVLTSSCHALISLFLRIYLPSLQQCQATWHICTRTGWE